LPTRLRYLRLLDYDLTARPGRSAALSGLAIPGFRWSMCAFLETIEELMTNTTSTRRLAILKQFAAHRAAA
jgi:hypothetical protein